MTWKYNRSPGFTRCVCLEYPEDSTVLVVDECRPKSGFAVRALEIFFKSLHPTFVVFKLAALFSVHEVKD